MRIERSLRKNDAYKHVKGDITLAVYPVTEDDKVNFIVFDIDTAKRKILESESVSIDEFRKKSHQDILRIKAVCEEMDLKLYIEDSGYKGRHGWLFFSKPEDASTALELGRIIMKKAGGPSDGTIWELFPMGKSERSKSMIKLPLGINLKNNRRCLFLSDHNEVIQDQAVLLQTIKKNSIEELVKQLKIEKEDIAEEKPTVPPEITQIVEKCAVINHLITKARDTHYLTHYERFTLLYTLSFAGNQGCEYLHKVISYCINYDPRYTQRQIDRRKSSPISCARIMEYFPELTESLSCGCKFKLPPKSYPSPILYLIQSEVEKAYEKTKDTEEESDRENSLQTPDETQEDHEDRLLNFDDIFSSETTTDESEIEQSVTEPVKAVEDSIVMDNTTEEPAKEITTEDIKEKSEDRLPVETEPDKAQAWSLVLDLMNLKQNQEKIRSEINDIHNKLNIIFDNLDTDTLSLAMGRVRRHRTDNGEIKWIIDV